MLEQLNEQLAALYPYHVGGGDLKEIADRLDLSRFTVHQYLSGKGKNIHTATDILREAMQIVEHRRELLEKAEILNELNPSE